MHTWKKTIALILCLVMVLAVTACGDSGNANSGSSSSKNEGGESSDDAGDTGEKDYSEKMVISWAGIQIDDTKDYNYGDELTRHFTEKFNIEWDITSLTFENWAERLRIWINSDDMPDMAVWNYLHGEAANYVDQDLVKQLPDNWKSQWPSLASAYSDTIMNEGVEEIFDGTYFLFRPVFSNNRPTEKLSTHMSAYVRTDWAEAVGYEVKDVMKTSELMELAYLFKENDPGNVAEQFGSFYPINMTSAKISYFVQFNSTYSGVTSLPYYLGDDGAYQWGPASEDTLTGLKIMSELYTEGLLHPEFYTIQDPDDYAMFHTTGQSGIYVGEGMAAWFTRHKQNFAEYQGLDFDEVVKLVTVVGEDGYYHGSAVTNYWCTNIFSPHIEDAKLERILDMLDYSCTEEAQLIIRMGFEDVDWESDGEGGYVSLLETGTSASDKYAIFPMYGNMFILSDDFQFINPGFAQNHRDLVKELYLTREANSTEKSLPSEPDWTVFFHESTALNLATMVYTDEYANLVTKEGDIEANWQAWVNEKMNLIQPVLDELNAKIS